MRTENNNNIIYSAILLPEFTHFGEYPRTLSTEQKQCWLCWLRSVDPLQNGEDGNECQWIPYRADTHTHNRLVNPHIESQGHTDRWRTTRECRMFSRRSSADTSTQSHSRSPDTSLRSDTASSAMMSQRGPDKPEKGNIHTVIQQLLRVKPVILGNIITT